MFPPAGLANLQDAVLPTLPDGRILLGGRAWEMPTPQNVDVFIGRLERAGLPVFDPLIEELRHGGAVRAMPERTSQSGFVRAVGLSRRRLQVVERGRHAARPLREGAAISDVVERCQKLPVRFGLFPRHPSGADHESDVQAARSRGADQCRLP